MSLQQIVADAKQQTSERYLKHLSNMRDIQKKKVEKLNKLKAKGGSTYAMGGSHRMNYEMVDGYVVLGNKSGFKRKSSKSRGRRSNKRNISKGMNASRLYIDKTHSYIKHSLITAIFKKREWNVLFELIYKKYSNPEALISDKLMGYHDSMINDSFRYLNIYNPVTQYSFIKYNEDILQDLMCGLHAKLLTYKKKKGVADISWLQNTFTYILVSSIKRYIKYDKMIPITDSYYLPEVAYTDGLNRLGIGIINSLKQWKHKNVKIKKRS